MEAAAIFQRQSDWPGTAFLREISNALTISM
jgi:hypothetical protein